MAEKLEDPEGIGSPPVGFVAVNHDRVLTADSLASHQLAKALAIEVVAPDAII